MNCLDAGSLALVLDFLLSSSIVQLQGVNQSFQKKIRGNKFRQLVWPSGWKPLGIHFEVYMYIGNHKKLLYIPSTKQLHCLSFQSGGRRSWCLEKIKPNREQSQKTFLQVLRALSCPITCQNFFILFDKEDPEISYYVFTQKPVKRKLLFSLLPHVGRGLFHSFREFVYFFVQIEQKICYYLFEFHLSDLSLNLVPGYEQPALIMHCPVDANIWVDILILDKERFLCVFCSTHKKDMRFFFSIENTQKLSSFIQTDHLRMESLYRINKNTFFSSSSSTCYCSGLQKASMVNVKCPDQYMMCRNNETDSLFACVYLQEHRVMSVHGLC